MTETRSTRALGTSHTADTAAAAAAAAVPAEGDPECAVYADVGTVRERASGDLLVDLSAAADPRSRKITTGHRH